MLVYVINKHGEGLMPCKHTVNGKERGNSSHRLRGGSILAQKDMKWRIVYIKNMS